MSEFAQIGVSCKLDALVSFICSRAREMIYATLEVAMMYIQGEMGT